MSTSFDPTALPTDSLLATAMRQVSKYWPLAYSKLLSLDWQWCSHTPYGATDGRVLLLNQAGLAKLQVHPKSVGLCAFLLVHEAMHALLGHGWRLAKLRDPQRANIAADYIINAMIDARNKELGKVVFPFIDGVLLDHKLSGDKSVEQLYRELQQTPPQPRQPQPDPAKQDEDQDDSNEGGDSAAGDVPADDSSGDSTGSSGDDGDPASAAPDGGAGVGSGENPLAGFVGTGTVDNHKPAVAEGESEDAVVNQIEEDNDRLLIADHIDRANGGDSGMTGTRVSQQRALPQPLPWAGMLHEWLRGSSRAGWSSPFNAPVHGSTGLVCCGRRKRCAGDIVLVVDTSGSVPAHIYDRFLGEARFILEQIQPERLHLLSVSHYVCDAHTLERGDQLPLSIKGGGGTCFQPAFDWVAKHAPQPDVLIYLTDGVAYDINSLAAVDYPVLWVSTLCRPEHYPFGDTIMTTDY